MPSVAAVTGQGESDIYAAGKYAHGHQRFVEYRQLLRRQGH